MVKNVGSVVRWQVAKLALVQGMQAMSSAFFTCGVVFTGAASSDSLGLALVLMFKTLPTLVMAFLGGVLADRLPRKTLASGMLGGLAISYGVGTWVVQLSGLGWPVQAISLAAGIIGAVGSPALFALLPSIAPPEDIVRANGLIRTFRNAGSVVGPLLGAWLAQLISPSFLFLDGAVCLAVSMPLVLSLKLMPSCDDEANNNDDDASMISALRSIPSLFHTYIWLAVGVPFWALFLAVQSGATDVTMPLWVVQESGRGAWSLMASITSSGYICGSLIALKLERPRHMFSKSVLFGALAIMPIFVVGTLDIQVLWYVASFVAGLGLELSGVFWGSTMQTCVDKRHMGRVSSIDYAISFGLIPLAYGLYGFTGTIHAAVVLTVSFSIMIVLVIIVFPFCYLIDHRSNSSGIINSSDV